MFFVPARKSAMTQCERAGKNEQSATNTPLTAFQQCKQSVGLQQPVLTAYSEPIVFPAASDVHGPARQALFTTYGDPRPSAPFLAEGNARWLQKQLEDALSRATGRQVRVPLDGRFIQEMQAVATTSLRPAPDGVGLAAMNRTFLERYFELQIASISHAALFHKYFIAQDRPWTQPYGEYSGGNSVTVSPSGYQTSHPWRMRQASFLKATTGLQAQGLTPKAVTESELQGLFVPNTMQYCRT